MTLPPGGQCGGGVWVGRRQVDQHGAGHQGQCQARRATTAAIAEFEARRADIEKAAAAKLADAQAAGEKLNGVVVKISQKAGVDGRLFGSVTNHDIADELVKMGHAVTKAQVRMPHGPLKAAGEYTVVVGLHTDVAIEVAVQVLGETA